MTGLVTVGCILITGGFWWWRCAAHRPSRATLTQGVL